MADRVKYERLQDLKAGVSGRQGVFVYAPIAQQDRVGVVKGSNSITVNGDGSLHVSEAYKLTTIQVMASLPSDLAPYEGALLIVGETLYKVESGVANPADLEFSRVVTYRTGYSGANIEYDDGVSVTININGIKHIFCDNQADSYFPFIYKKTEVDAFIANVNARIDDIEAGDVPAGKAIADKDGRTIDTSYASKITGIYYQTSNNLSLTLRDPHGTDIPSSTHVINLPLATASLDGLLSKADKVRLNNLDTNLAAKENKSEKGVANGYASLDGGAKVPSSQLPDSILGQLEYKGIFDPASGYPSTPEKGWFYISIANATISGVDYKIGDWAVYNGTSWDKVDNTDAVASVQGKIGNVVINGTEILVGNGDAFTVEQRIVNIYAELNNRYTKAQTYSNTEIEQRLTDLLALANLQDVLIGTYTNGQTVLASDLSPYNFVIVLGKDVNNTYTATFKPSEIVSDNVISLSSTVYLTRGATNFTITTPTSVKLWGIKLDGINTVEITHKTTETLEHYLDNLDSDQVYFNSGLEDIDNLVVNGDFSNGTTGWTFSSGISSSITNGFLQVNPNAQSLIFQLTNSISVSTTDTYYFSFNGYAAVNGATYRMRVDNVNLLADVNLTLNNSNYSYITTLPTGTFNNKFISYTNSVGVNAYFDNFSLFNVSTMKLKGVKDDNGVLFSDLTNADIKLQLDTWVQNGTLGKQTLREKFTEIGTTITALENKVDLVNINQDIRINEIEELARKSASGETSDNVLGTDVIPLSKDTANAPMSVEVDGGILEAPNLVANSDLTLDSNSDGIPDGFNYYDTTSRTLISGIATFTATAKYGRLQTSISITANDIIYYFASVKATSNSVYLVGVANIPSSNAFHSGNGQFQFLSKIQIASGSYNFLVIGDNLTTGFNPISVDYVGAFNVSKMKLKGVKDDNGTLFSALTDGQIKTQLDLWISKGILPNDNLLSVNMNKRVRSEVGGDTIEKKYQLVANGDFSEPNTFWSKTPAVNTATEIVNITDKVYLYTTGAMANIYRNNLLTINDTYYLSFDLQVISGRVASDGLLGVVASNNGFNSFVGVANLTTFSIKRFVSSETTEAYIDNIKLFNVSQMKRDGWFVGMDNTQIKAFLDKVLQQGKANSDLYLQANVKGYSLPNGVKDTIEYRNGKYYHVQRVKKYVLQASDFHALNTSFFPGVDLLFINKNTDYIGYNTISINSNNTIITSYTYSSDNIDNINDVGQFSVAQQNLYYIWGIEKGIYATLAEAQTALAGTVIYYQLATPIETEIEAWGNLQGYESGIVYVDDIKIDASIYASGIATTSEIKTLDEIVKINNGVETQLDTSLAVIAVNKLSFTHPNLGNGDYVWFAYEEDGNYYKATTDITYYIDKLVRTSPDGSVWKLDWSVSNLGVITWTPTKI